MRVHEIPIVNKKAYLLLNVEGGHASVMVCHYLDYKSVLLSLSGFSPKLMTSSPFH